MKRWLSALIGAAVCCFGFWQAVRIGLARTFAHKATLTNDRSAADAGVRWLANDAATRTSRGLVLERTGDYGAAVRDFERAVQLRPRDYFPWLLLGVTRDLNHDQAGAASALRQSIALAPAYAKPHWFLGNLLLRTGQFDQAFGELRFAAKSDFELLPNVIDLAWGINGHDPVRTVAAIQPDADVTRLALALYFASHEQGAAALEQFRSLTKISEESGSKLVAELLRAKQFTAALEVWNRTHAGSSPTPRLLNGDFEEDVQVGKTGFGWQIPSDLPNLTMSVDGAQFGTGARSLRVDFAGESDPARPLVSQIVIVKGGGKYRLTFKALTREFVSAAPVMIVVSDAADAKTQAIAKSAPLSNISSWQEFVIEFSAPATTEAIRIALNRAPCNGQPCAAFGTVWVDSFRLQAG